MYFGWLLDRKALAYFTVFSVEFSVQYSLKINLSYFIFQPEVMVVSLFVTQDFGLLLQDSFAKAANLENLIGLKVPYFYYQQQVIFQLKFY